MRLKNYVPYKLMEKVKVLNGIKLKMVDDELFWWKTAGSRGPLVTPYWRFKKPCINPNGYMVTRLNRKNFYYHRIVFWFGNDDFDIEHYDNTEVIDHIDRDKSNNKLENLRLITFQENLFNQKAKGWCYFRERYIAQVCVNGKHHYLGSYHTPEEARCAYLEGKKKYHPIATNN
tara:strand:+ start:1226 stop:1747 length:522 start_codon:yes stop_codon:yes gene_type:complete